eukprot:TRINITY_DN15660_c0_g1_i2.p2 TRINITY_DN15660_c0_g1~~TRINITY_DN15660_c0_g1_i2.p2  ORF type:complete len:164 (+),score=38.02 TRINITY_DN15660_c0_g1_i2:884-1375(+)
MSPTRGNKKTKKQKEDKDQKEERKKSEGAARRLVQFDWKVPADFSYQYAKICGDFNPIHVSKYTAPLFGYSKPIIHGMSVVGRAYEALLTNDQTIQYPVYSEVEFVRPTLIPTTLSVSFTVDQVETNSVLEKEFPAKARLNVTQKSSGKSTVKGFFLYHQKKI